MKNKNILLLLAGIFSFGVAIFQLVIVLVPDWSAYFGAGEALVSNPLLLLAAGIGMTIVFAICGFYGLSGAGVIRRLPLLRLGIFAIGAVYIYRGLPVVFQLLEKLKILPPGPSVNLPGQIVFVVSFIIGLFYWAGFAIGWKQLGLKAAPARPEVRPTNS